MRISIYILLLIIPCQSLIGQEDLGNYISNNKLYGEIKDGLPEKDTLIQLNKNGIILGKGAVAVNEDGPSSLKVGYWKEYAENGTLKMEGNYELGSYVSCCLAGPCRSFHYYRTGLWKIYDDKGKLKYELTFEPTELYIDTTCEGGDKLLFGIVKEIPLKYLDDLTSGKIFKLQQLKTENEFGTGTWTPLNGRIFIE